MSSVALVVLWAFNPLGSQASLRGIYLQDSLGHGTGQITYYNHNLTTQLEMTLFVKATTRSKPTVRAIYSAALYDITSGIQYVNHTTPAASSTIALLGGDQAAGIQSALDLWGNLRIPALEYLPDYNAEQPDRWLQVPWTESIQNYASLIGDRVDGIDRAVEGNITFDITSSYQSFRVGAYCPYKTCFDLVLTL
jgi:hypothetical protein